MDTAEAAQERQRTVQPLYFSLAPTDFFNRAGADDAAHCMPDGPLPASRAQRAKPRRCSRSAAMAAMRTG